MKENCLSVWHGLSAGVVKLLGLGNGLIAHTGKSRLGTPVSRIHLEKGELYTVPPETNALQVQVIRGAFWLTHENDRRDWIVKAGETLSVRNGQRTIIEALEAGELDLVEKTLPSG